MCFEGASVEAQANSDSADPRAAPAEFQTRRSSAVQEIQLRVQSIFSLRSDGPQANTHTHTHTHTLFSLTHDRGAVKGFDEKASRRGEQTDASSEHAGAIRGEMCRVASRWQTCGLHMKNFLDLPLLQLSKGTMTPRLQTTERFIQEVFLFIETLVALHSPNLQ